MESNSIEVTGKENPPFIFIFEDGTIRADDLLAVDDGVPIRTVMNTQVYSGGVK